jgi:hypothetical protein
LDKKIANALDKKKKNKKMQVKTERKWREKAGLDSGVN